ncbi:MAG: hypothetical protein RLY20_2610 [Verrucomicrobiota bacterium]
MVRPSLNDLPAVSLPQGFSFRWFRRGDAAHWLLIHHDADPFNDITPDLFTRQFGLDLSVLENRQVFVQDDIGRVVGTATCWPAERTDLPQCGRVFWLAVMRHFQGRGLGRALLTAVCARMREFGYGHACVITSTGRLPAVKLYLHAGFSPEAGTAEDHRVWDTVLAALNSQPSRLPSQMVPGELLSTPPEPRQWPLRPG